MTSGSSVLEEFEAVGIEAHLVYQQGAGHNFDREMILRTQAELEWLMAEVEEGEHR